MTLEMLDMKSVASLILLIKKRAIMNLKLFLYINQSSIRYCNNYQTYVYRF